MIAVCDYGIGNLRSAEKALQHLGASARLVQDPGALRGADGVVLPGVGAFGRCADALEATGFARTVRTVIEDGTPFLGICIGFQLLYERSEEDEDVRGLGIFPGKVRALPPSVKRPQMQWNEVHIRRPSGLLHGFDAPPWLYFVHSFAAQIGPETVATCEYGGNVVAACELDNVWGVQFHPEKSGSSGLDVLGNFVRRCKSAA